MAERIVSMHAAHRSGKEVMDNFLSRPTAGGELDRFKKKYEIEMYEGAGHGFLNNPHSKSAANRAAAEKSVGRTAKWLRKSFA
jgi:dienelactone hydrolase